MHAEEVVRKVNKYQWQKASGALQQLLLCVCVVVFSFLRSVQAGESMRKFVTGASTQQHLQQHLQAALYSRII